MTDAIETMLNWLSGNFVMFGLNGQNWMLLVGIGPFLYIAVLIAARHLQDRKRPTTH